MNNYILKNETKYDDVWIHKIIAYCHPVLPFEIFITHNEKACMECYGKNIKFKSNFLVSTGACHFQNREIPLISIYLNPRAKYPYFSSKNNIYRQRVVSKNEKHFLIKAIAHEIRHLKNFVIPIRKYLKRNPYIWENPAVQKIYKKAEYSSQTYERNIFKNLKRKQLI